MRNVILWTLGILIGALVLTDCFGGPTEHVQGKVEGRHYRPPYTSVSCSGKPMHCHTVHHSASYTLYVRSWEGLASVSTNAAGYATVADQATLTYTRERTRWSNYTWGNSYDAQ